MNIDKDIISRVMETIASYSLVEQGDRVLVGLSGGPDSMALLSILHELQTEYHIEIAAVYVNHKIRPRSAKKEAGFCRDFCTKINVPFFYEEVDIPVLAQRDKTGIEETARKYRYEILCQVAKVHDYTKIAVGHHRDDRVETILFNLFRGAGRRGFIGFQPLRDTIIRPLYDISRQEILQYLEKSKIPYVTDDSNESFNYTRNRLRHKIIPLIKSEISESAPENILRLATIIRDEERFLERYVFEIYNRLRDVTPGGKNRLDLRGKLEYDVWLERRMLFMLLSDAGLFDTGFARVERLMSMIDAGINRRLQLTGDYYAELSGGYLYVYSSSEQIESLTLHIPGQFKLPYPRVWLKLSMGERSMIDTVRLASGNVAYMDAEELVEPLVVSGIRRGERFHPFGRPGSKKVGDFLTDRKYPRPLRDELPILYDKMGVVWLGGIEIDKRVAITEKTRKIVRIEIGKY